MTILAIDPGPTESGWLVLSPDGVPTSFAKSDTAAVIGLLRLSAPRRVVVEMVACYGMPAGREIFETCVVIGRLLHVAEQAGHQVDRLYRQDVKLHLCRSVRANDATIRQALLDRFGPGKDVAVGSKSKPGPLYGIHGDCWSALALAVTWHDRTHQTNQLA